jgi:hypothetical protein
MVVKALVLVDWRVRAGWEVGVRVVALIVMWVEVCRAWVERARMREVDWVPVARVMRILMWDSGSVMVCG